MRDAATIFMISVSVKIIYEKKGETLVAGIRLRFWLPQYLCVEQDTFTFRVRPKKFVDVAARHLEKIPFITSFNSVFKTALTRA